MQEYVSKHGILQINLLYRACLYVTASFQHKMILFFLFAQFSSKNQILQSLSNLFFQDFCKQYLSVQLALTEVFAVNSKLCSCSVLLQLAKQTNKDWHGSEIFSLEKILSAAFVGQCGKRHRCLSQSRRKVKIGERGPGGGKQ